MAMTPSAPPGDKHGGSIPRGGKRATGWDALTPGKAKLPNYDALYDQNLRAHYEKRGVRRQLLEGSLIDRVGRILRGNSTKLNIIEQEFRNAERDEQRRQQDEEYERRKLEARKKYMRVHRDRIAQCKERREHSLARRQQYATRYFSFLPAGTGSLAGGATIREGPRSARAGRVASAASSGSGEGKRPQSQGEKRPSTARRATRASSAAPPAAARRRSSSGSSSGSGGQSPARSGAPLSPRSPSSGSSRSHSSGSREEEERASQSEEEAASGEESEDYDDES
eukprot:Hpha_TRINITY_DN16810_c1_g2::TRINITY_DN16810_c1_g2_i1::g.150787::m.150787